MKYTTTTILAAIASCSLLNAQSFTVENDQLQDTIQLANSSGNILTSGTVDFLYRISGSDSDSAITSPTSGLNSYVSSNFASLGSGSIGQVNVSDPFGGSFSYYAFTASSANLSSTTPDPGYGENPYFYLNTGSEALLYRFDETMVGGTNTDFIFTLGDGQDLGSNLIGTFDTDATDIGGNVVDTYRLQAIPEPSSIALLGLGSIALVTRRKR